MKTEIAQLQIQLNYIEPKIWRRFIVDFSISLHKLHEIIQDVMGWENSHLYSFYFQKMEYSLPFDDEFADFGEKVGDSKKAKLNNIGIKQRDKIRYLYDHGDSWEHTITVEKIYESQEGTKVPYCLEGERNCPPEDCGSFPGYEEIVDAMKKPNSKEGKRFIEWLGEPYDPGQFDIKRINDSLKPKTIKKK